MDYQEEIAKVLLKIDAVGFKPKDPVIFKSGIKSPVYVDNRKFPFYVGEWHKVIEGFENLINRERLEFDLIAGVAVGGIPHSAALGYKMNKPSVFVRKEAKEHGQKKRVEGGEVANRKVLLVEDLVSTGSSSLSGINALRGAGAKVNDCLVIIAYGFKEAVEAFTKEKVKLYSLTTFPIVLKEALSQGKFNEEEYNVIQDWFSDPHGWAERQGF